MVEPAGPCVGVVVPLVVRAFAGPDHGLQEADTRTSGHINNQQLMTATNNDYSNN